MSTFLERNARRLLIAGGLAVFVGVPTIACTGSTEVVDDGAADDDGGKDKKKDAATPESKIVGTWQMRPPADQLRNFKIMDAALSGKAQKKQKLGKMSGAEQQLFEQVKGMKGAEKKMVNAQLKFMKQSQFTFSDSDVTVQFGADEKFGPVKYTVVTASDDGITMKFDPGLGNGMETHAITWTNAKKGVNKISAGGQDFTALDISKK
jgi:hypothetical protein